MFIRLAPVVPFLLVLVLAGLLVDALPSLSASEARLLELLPLGLTLLMLVLCSHFNRSRLFFCSLAVLLVYLALRWLPPGLDMAQAEVLRDWLAIWLPAVFILLSLLEERGIFTWHGLLRFGILLLPLLLLYAGVILQPSWLVHLYALRLLEFDSFSLGDFSQLAIVSLALALLILNGLLFLRPDVQRATPFFVLVVAILMLMPDTGRVQALYASAASCMVLLAVIQESWRMAYLDQLTRLPGRRALDENLMKLGHVYSIAMLDIDHFKKFNDRHGHDAGDQVLQMVASHIRRVGGGGKAYRYGGEEFCVVFPGRSLGEVMVFLEALRGDIDSARFQLRRTDRRRQVSRSKKKKRNLRVTLSIGVAERRNRQERPEDVIKAADQALYRAKKRGRNRVCK